MRRLPRALVIVLFCALGAQVIWQSGVSPSVARMRDFGAAPPMEWMRLSTLGDPVPVAILWMLWLQTFDDQAGVIVPFKRMNFAHLAIWLERILALDPRSEYPLLVALQVWGAVQDADKLMRMHDFVHQAFLAAPQKRWQWMALATVQARHRLKDHGRARLFMADLTNMVLSHPLAFWVRGLQGRMTTQPSDLGKAVVLLRAMLYEEISDQQKQALESRIAILEEQKAILNSENGMVPWTQK